MDHLQVEGSSVIIINISLIEGESHLEFFLKCSISKDCKMMLKYLEQKDVIQVFFVPASNFILMSQERF